MLFRSVKAEGLACVFNVSVETFDLCAGRRCCQADPNLADQHKLQRLPGDSEQDSAH